MAFKRAKITSQEVDVATVQRINLLVSTSFGQIFAVSCLTTQWVLSTCVRAYEMMISNLARFLFFVP